MSKLALRVFAGQGNRADLAASRAGPESAGADPSNGSDNREQRPHTGDPDKGLAWNTLTALQQRMYGLIAAVEGQLSLREAGDDNRDRIIPTDVATHPQNQQGVLIQDCVIPISSISQSRGDLMGHVQMPEAAQAAAEDNSVPAGNAASSGEQATQQQVHDSTVQHQEDHDAAAKQDVAAGDASSASVTQDAAHNSSNVQAGQQALPVSSAGTVQLPSHSTVCVTSAEDTAVASAAVTEAGVTHAAANESADPQPEVETPQKQLVLLSSKKQQVNLLLLLLCQCAHCDGASIHCVLQISSVRLSFIIILLMCSIKALFLT